jgi:hypothetical protein
MLRIPHMAVRLSPYAPATLYSPETFSDAHFCEGLCQSHGHSAAGRIRQIKKFSDLIGTGAPDLSDCNIIASTNYYDECIRPYTAFHKTIYEWKTTDMSIWNTDCCLSESNVDYDVIIFFSTYSGKQNPYKQTTVVFHWVSYSMHAVEWEMS